MGFFRILLKTIAGLLLLLIALVVIMGLVGVKVDLSHLRGGVELAAGQAMGREVTIVGPVEMEFSNWPALEVSDVRVANIAGAAQADFFTAGLARLRVGVYPLLRGEINIAEITAENVTLNLETDARGHSNWVFGEAGTPLPEQPGETGSMKDGRLISFAALDQLSLRQITINYHNGQLNRSQSFVLEFMQGTAAKNDPVMLELAGRLNERSYDLKLEGSPLVGLLEDKDRPWGFAVTGEVFGKEIFSKGDLILSDQEPEANFALELRDLDVGYILSELELVEGMQASLGDVAMKVSINGGSLQDILRQSAMLFAVKDGSWKVTLPNTEASFDINELSGEILVEKGNNITMKLDGVIDETPVKLLVTGAPLVEYVTRQHEIPLNIDAEFSSSRLSFSSRTKLPLTNRDITLALKMNSERLDHLNELLRLDLPPVGPVSLESQLGLINSGYDLSKLVMQVGDSRLDGKLRLSTNQAKPKLDIDLVSSLIQLDDFDTSKTESAAKKQPPGDAGVEEPTPGTATEETQADERRNLLSYEVMKSFDADIKIDAQDVRSGKDKLGSSSMQIGLRDARLAVEPLNMKLPGGGVRVDFDYTPSATGVIFNLKADVDEFDLGVVARRAKPDTDMGGKLTLDVELHSQAADLASVMEHANGYFDFLLVPQNFSAGVVDLWAANLLSAIMEKSTEKDDSKINCVVVRFGIDDGLMEEKAIYLDTSNMRIAGKSKIDFKARELEIKLAPKAKNPEFFTMAVPIKVKGSFEDFALKIGMLRMGGQLVSFVTSPFHVPIRRVFTEETPADGMEACEAAWTRTGDEESAASPGQNLPADESE